jgi:DNA processing protein
MEKVLKNFIILEGLLKRHSISREKILRHFKGYAGIQWKYVYENQSLFDAENLPPYNQLMSEVQNEIIRLGDLGIHSVDNTSIFFPDDLKQIKPEVHLLFTKGEQGLLSLPKKVAIVGSRKPTAYGRKVAYDLGNYLGKRGVVIVSGMALGIDAQAHKGCIEGGGRTIAVLASGVNKIYPASNENCMREFYHLEV